MAGIFWLPKTEIRNRDLENQKSEIGNQKSVRYDKKADCWGQQKLNQNQNSTEL